MYIDMTVLYGNYNGLYEHRIVRIRLKYLPNNFSLEFYVDNFFFLVWNIFNRI